MAFKNAEMLYCQLVGEGEGVLPRIIKKYTGSSIVFELGISYNEGKVVP